MRQVQYRSNICESQPQCAARLRLLKLEHAARLRIAQAERDSDTIPLKEIAVFRKSQEARWRHEAVCEICGQAVAA